MKVPVHVIGLEVPVAAERTFTENVSPHGARILTKRRWEPDEKALMTSLMGGFRRPVRVVYCQPVADARFLVGLEFRGPSVNWVNGPSDSSA